MVASSSTDWISRPSSVSSRGESRASTSASLQVGAHVPGLLERAGPGLAELHDLGGKRVLVAVRLGEIVGDQEGAHGGLCSERGWGDATRDAGLGRNTFTGDVHWAVLG